MLHVVEPLDLSLRLTRHLHLSRLHLPLRKGLSRRRIAFLCGLFIVRIVHAGLARRPLGRSGRRFLVGVIHRQHGGLAHVHTVGLVGVVKSRVHRLAHVVYSMHGVTAGHKVVVYGHARRVHCVVIQAVVHVAPRTHGHHIPIHVANGGQQRAVVQHLAGKTRGTRWESAEIVESPGRLVVPHSHAQAHRHVGLGLLRGEWSWLGKWISSLRLVLLLLLVVKIVRLLQWNLGNVREMGLSLNRS
mmetsp:Transcript_59056/g.103827  ORF Transcript_59056/g.103827 Transcript_59056/m.103827 type:complete len:244 (+) Transcript_59056:1089-1820(+)